MKTYHIGGINPFHRFKTLNAALQVVQDDDTIEIHKNLNEVVNIDKNIIIHGNNHKLTVPSGKAGIHCEQPLELSDLNLEINSRANGIVTNQDLILNNVNTNIIGPIREFYPTIQVTINNNHPQLDINNCDLQMIIIGDGVQGTFNNCKFSSYYKEDIMLGTREDMSHLNGILQLNNCDLRSIIFGFSQVQDNKTILYGNVTCNNCQINKYIDIDGKAIFNNCQFKLVDNPYNPKDYKKEPERGPLINIVDSKYGIAVRNHAELTLNNYNIIDASQDFLGVYSNQASLNLLNTNNKQNQISHQLIDTVLSCHDTNDENYWDIQGGNMAYVRSKINSNAHYVTAYEKLNNMIGQDNVKNEVKTIMNTIKVNQKHGDSNFDFSYNMIFAGDPGVGKTTIAKTVTQALFEVGAIRLNKFTKIEAGDLVAPYVGQTRSHAKGILDKAKGGVILIDEAYDLIVKDNENSFNGSALNTLITTMEDDRSDLIVIAAGYTEPMKKFLASNEGLSRRFKWIQFDDYSNHELAGIFEVMRKSYHDEYADNNLAKLIEPLISKVTNLNLSIPDAKGHYNNGGNGGLIRNIYQSVVEHRNNRIVKNPSETHKLTQDDIAIGFQEQINSTLARKPKRANM